MTYKSIIILITTLNKYLAYFKQGLYSEDEFMRDTIKLLKKAV